MTQTTPAHAAPATALKRTLTLVPTVLYGLGVTIGAGIYVLIGAMAGHAGVYAPIAFVAAAAMMSLTAATFAELGSRIPVSASEAAYVEAAFRSKWFSLAAGLLVFATSVISAAAIGTGSVGYIRIFVDVPSPMIVAIVILFMGAIAAWGIVESVMLAGIMTVIEIGGLLLLIGAGLWADPEILRHLPNMFSVVPTETAWPGIWAAALLAVFAFIGFEGIVNITEEVHQPVQTLPRAIFLTLAISAILYFMVTYVALNAIGPLELAKSDAPLALSLQRLTGLHPAVMSAIAIIAILNGVIVQLIMASRVLYGLSSQGRLPPLLGVVSPVTRTPLNATLLAVAVALTLALLIPLDRLAGLTARVVLVLYALINLSLAWIKWREQEPPADIFVSWRWVPVCGFLGCVLVLLFDGYQQLR